jgi:energy-coupling factor transporter transmembrane protein EcfT
MEILSQTNNWEIWFMMIPVTIALFFLLIGSYIGYEEHRYFQFYSLLVTALIILTGSIVYCSKEDDKKVLKVIATDIDKVNFDKYFILENEGKIVTLKEK